MPSTHNQQHLAAVLPSAGSALQVQYRPTPTPGPNDLLIAVKSIALNPVDYNMRDYGFNIASYPAVLGSDVSGTIISAGASVPSTPAYALGTRVAAFAPAFFAQGLPDYGAMQARVLVPAANAVPLPDHVTFDEGALLPMAVATAWAGLYTVGVPRDTRFAASDKQAILVWGGATSVGSAAIQVARLLGYAVYATASSTHHEYLQKLGAKRVFNYRDAEVVEKVVEAVRRAGETITVAYDAAGSLEQCQEILKQLNPQGGAKIAHAPPLPQPTPKVEGVEVKFVMSPTDAGERAEYFRFIFGDWLKEKLETKEFVPSPSIKIVGGLDAAQAGLEELKAGVSGTKLVLNP
ncbi:Alcohol dehydrogenase superfamily zinc-containing [Macrophomina phaseolina MS6]|uniref:Alcohol dehydrogenase superfamily zinc-containing n=2 Tax=Macrophomina phaseolina TaxID=35725 RepID=K2RDU4_MACPH|nr:Alcohol dehydrogenase superfamily zinc-containing [Macrophomina phaseolina MS6]KAH7012390.1 chaperonin 10-like protein [Macrophomina phaseolina]